jgi:hypothetical protein
MEALAAAVKSCSFDSNIIRQEWLAQATPVPVSPEELAEKAAGLDTRQNAIVTVGTGKTYSTIGAAVTAASAGDIVECYATGSNTYTEAVAITKSLQLRAMIADHGLIITFNSGSTVNVTTNAPVVVEGFTLTTTSTSGIAANCGGAVVYAQPVYRNCIIWNNAGSAGTTIGINSLSAAGGNPVAVNCEVYGFATGIYGAATRHVTVLHCTVSNCTIGMTANTTNNCHPMATVSAGNGTDFAAIGSSTVAIHAVSADATAAGINPVTGFATADFENYAGNDLRIKASVKTTTAARILGCPWLREDGLGQIRRRSAGGYFYAGWHDPDPGVIPTGAAVDPTLFTAFGLDNELTAAMDVPALSSVVPPDTLRGVAGTSPRRPQTVFVLDADDNSIAVGGTVDFSAATVAVEEAITGATVVAKVHNAATHAEIATLFTAAAQDFSAGVARTLAAIKGSAPTWTDDQGEGDYELIVTITDDEITTEASRYGFAVVAAGGGGAPVFGGHIVRRA